MVKLPEDNKMFAGVESLKGQGSKDFLVGKPLKIKAYVKMLNEDDSYAIAYFEAEGKEYTGSFGAAVLKKLELADNAYGTEVKGIEKHFKEAIEVTLKKLKSDKGREYFVIE